MSKGDPKKCPYMTLNLSKHFIAGEYVYEEKLFFISGEKEMTAIDTKQVVNEMSFDDDDDIYFI